MTYFSGNVKSISCDDSERLSIKFRMKNNQVDNQVLYISVPNNILDPKIEKREYIRFNAMVSLLRDAIIHKKYVKVVHENTAVRNIVIYDDETAYRMDEVWVGR